MSAAIDYKYDYSALQQTQEPGVNPTRSGSERDGLLTDSYLLSTEELKEIEGPQQS
jgi:hypothetical protein